jgi:hypothetical protein
MSQELMRIASRVVWWNAPEQVLSPVDGFLCRVMALGDPADANFIEDTYGPGRLRAALQSGKRSLRHSCCTAAQRSPFAPEAVNPKTSISSPTLPSMRKTVRRYNHLDRENRASPPRRATYADYLAAEQSSETRHEFIDSVIVAMSGGSDEHNAVAAPPPRWNGTACWQACGSAVRRETIRRSNPGAR